MGDSMFSFAINEMVKLHGEWGEVFKHLRSTQCILKTFHFRRVTFVDVCLQCDSPTLTTLHGCGQAGADDDFKIWKLEKHVCTSTAVLKGQFYLIDPVGRRRLMSRSYEGNLFNYFFSWFFQISISVMMHLLQGDPCQRSVHDVPNSHRGSTPFPLHSSPWSIVLWSFMHFPILAEVHAHLCQVLGPLSEEEVVQSNRFIKLLYNFMVDGKPGKGQQEFEGWLPSTGNKTVDVGGV